MVIIGIAALLIVMIGVVVLIIFLPGGEENSVQDSEPIEDETTIEIEEAPSPLSDVFLPSGNRCKRGFIPNKRTYKDLFNFELAGMQTVDGDCK